MTSLTTTMENVTGGVDTHGQTHHGAAQKYSPYWACKQIVRGVKDQVKRLQQKRQDHLFPEPWSRKFRRSSHPTRTNRSLQNTDQSSHRLAEDPIRSYLLQGSSLTSSGVQDRTTSVATWSIRVAHCTAFAASAGD